MSGTVSDSLPAVLAIDGGNSKTEMVLVANDGTLLATVRGPGASQEHHGIEGAMRILRGLVRELAEEARVASDGPVARHASAYLAGCDLPAEEAALTEALRAQGWSATAVAANDTFALLRAGLPDDVGGSGVAVTCGAGINCVAVGPDGRVARYLALGTLTGDWGGGRGLAHAMMWHAMRAEDGRGPATSLGPAMAAHFGLPSVADIAIAVHQGRLGEWDDLITMVPVLFAAAAADDEVAASLVDRQAAEVCLMAVTAMRRLGLPSEGTTVVLGGGLLQARDPLLSRALNAEFTVRAPGATLRVANVPPVAGAALLGLDHLGLTARAAERLRQCFAAPSQPPKDSLATA